LKITRICFGMIRGVNSVQKFWGFRLSWQTFYKYNSTFDIWLWYRTNVGYGKYLCVFTIRIIRQVECSVSGVSEHFWSIDRATNVAHSKLLMKTIKFLHNLSLWAFMTLWSSKKKQKSWKYFLCTSSWRCDSHLCKLSSSHILVKG